MSKRWSYLSTNELDDNNNEIQCFVTITGINGTNVAFDKEAEVFLINKRRQLFKTGFATLKEAQHVADPEFTKNPIIKKPRKTHLSADYIKGTYTLRKWNGDILGDYYDATTMLIVIKKNYPRQEVLLKINIYP